MAGLERKLGRLSSFGCGGFEIHGAELANRPTSMNCSDAVQGEQRKEKESEARRREK